MEKYLVTIEFRYNDAPKYIDDFTSRNETVTIGVYDSFHDACKDGNKVLIKLEGKFPIHKFPSGNEAEIERFSENGGCLGRRKTLVSNLAYLKTPFQFFAKITKLTYDDIDTIVDDATDACKRYKNYKLNEE